MAVNLKTHTHWTGVTGTSVSQDMSTSTLLIALIAGVNSAATITDTQGNTWIGLNTITNGVRMLNPYYLIGALGFFSSTLQATIATGAAMNAVMAGFDPTSPVFQTQTTGGTSATTSVQSTNAITPGGATNLVFTGLGGDANTSITTPAGYTVVDNVVNTPYGPQGVGLAWIEQAANTSQQPTWNVTANGSALTTALWSYTFTGGGGGGRGLFRTPPMTGAGIGGSFFRDPLQAREQMVKRNHIYVPARFAA